MSNAFARRIVVVSAVLVAFAVAVPLASAAIVADTIADFPAFDNTTGASKQGINNWTYGYHADTLAAGFSYSAGSFISFPDNAGPGAGPADFWTGSAWDWTPGNPPWTQIEAAKGHPNGTNNGVEHWAIRRWSSTVEGALTVTVAASKGGGGEGTTTRVFANGNAFGALTIPPSNSRTWTFFVPYVAPTDPVDIALDPTGTSNTPTDGSDSTTYSALIDHVSPLRYVLRSDSKADFPTADNVTSDSKQGINGWQYGYHNVTVNGTYDASDFIAFPDNAGPGTSATDFWNGSAWDFTPGNPPWTFIGDDEGHPNTGGDDHWAIRRWIADSASPTYIELFLAKQNINGGDGTRAAIYQNGTLIGELLVDGTDGIGYTDVFFLPGVVVGDTIDIILDYRGDDGNDGSLFTAKIYQYTPEPGTLTLLAVGGMGALCRRRRQRRA